MLTSKDILEKTGISRATLNNYIASGLVARPDVLPPGPEDGDAPRIGYFPDDTIERIETIQRLKREGWSIGRIAEHFAKGAQAPVPAPAQTPPAAAPQPVRAAPAPAPEARAPSAPLSSARGRRSVPTLTRVAVLVSTLEDAPALWVRLSAEEYFELVNEVWAELDRILRSYHGVPGRHPDEGVVSYFLPGAGASHLWSAVEASLEARAAMRALSLRWQARKGWDVELALDTGIDEGEEWIGAIGSDALRVVGDAADRAEQLSRCGHGGAILATRRFVGRLPAAQRDRVHFGVRRQGGDAPVLQVFGRLADIAPAGSIPARLAGLAVAEIFDVQARPAQSSMTEATE